jgi:Fur family transcriptional regulator, iron response regulator
MENSARTLLNKVDAAPAGASAAFHGLQGCPVHDLRLKLRDAGLRPTRQRVALGWLLFARGDRHVTAEKLYEEATTARVPISLATVYNTLHQFTEVGLLREIAVDGSKTYFDTNVTNHHHFLIEETNQLVDIPGSHVVVQSLPEVPEGFDVSSVDVIIRVSRKDKAKPALD